MIPFPLPSNRSGAKLNLNMNTNPIAYINGRYVAAENAHISPLDRGFLFGDGVYEVIPAYNGHLFLLDPHLDRLNQSLNDIKMEPPHTHAEWHTILNTLVQKNGHKEQSLYLQITRGAEATRNIGFHKHIPPTIFAISFPCPLASKDTLRKGIKITGISDIRWKHCHIKTTSRLAYVLMYQEAKEAGFDEALIIREGSVLEGTSSNVLIAQHGIIKTPPKSNDILSGITRDCILNLAKDNHIPCQEIALSEHDIVTADEMWITSSSRGIHPVTQFNDKLIGTGKVGPLWEQLWDLYANEIAKISL
jgi:D-alanine transaminase